MYTSVKTRKKTRHVGPTCLKIPGENIGVHVHVYYVYGTYIHIIYNTYVHTSIPVEDQTVLYHQY